MLSLRVREDIGVMARRRYSTFFRFPELEPHQLIQFSVISREIFLAISCHSAWDTVSVFFIPTIDRFPEQKNTHKSNYETCGKSLQLNNNATLLKKLSPEDISQETQSHELLLCFILIDS